MLDETTAYEINEGVITWRGHNKENMRCCVVTGRMLDPERREGSNNSFRKYIVKSVEDNLQEVSDKEMDQICVIYDRYVVASS